MPDTTAAPFDLPSLSGERVQLSRYRYRSNVVLWFSRGFTCHFCRTHMDQIGAGYARLRDAQAEVIQVMPNPLDTARTFYAASRPPFPVVFDPDKSLYATYGLVDRGAGEAARSAAVTFVQAFAKGDASAQIRGVWTDVANKGFLGRVQHHTLTAVEQGLFIIDMLGQIRHRIVLGPIDPLPTVDGLVELVRRHTARLVR